MTTLPTALLILLSASGFAQPDQLTPGQKARAEAIAKGHYQKLIQTWRALEWSAVDRANPARALSCGISSFTAPSELPDRMAQPGVFSQIQAQLSGTVSACQSRLDLSPQSLRDVQDQFLALLKSNSQTSFCTKDSDCKAVLIDRDRCQAGAEETVVSSELTDGMFFSALRRYLPGLAAQMRMSLKPEERAADCGQFLITDAKAVCRDSLCQALPAAAK